MKRFLLSIILVLTFASVGLATDWYVAASGTNGDGSKNNPWVGLSNIVQGEGGLQAGDTLHLWRGITYSGYLKMTVSGSKENPIRITADQGTSKDNAIIDSSGLSRSLDIDVLNTNSTLEYLIFRNINFTKSSSSCLYITTRSDTNGSVGNITFINCCFTDSEGVGANILGIGINGDYTHDINFVQCTFQDNVMEGLNIYGRSIKNISMKYCIFRGNGNGIFNLSNVRIGNNVPSSGSWTLYSGTTYYSESSNFANYVTDRVVNTTDDVELSQGTDKDNLGVNEFVQETSENRLYINLGGDDPSDKSLYIKTGYVENIELDKCVFLESGDSNLNLYWFAEDVVVKRCIFTNSANSALEARSTKNLNLTYCLFLNNCSIIPEEGVIVLRESCLNTQIANCTIKGLKNDSTVSIYARDFGDTLNVSNCIIFSSYIGIRINSDFSNVSNDYNCFFNNDYDVIGASMGNNSMISNPKIRHYYRIFRNSPCVDAGTKIIGIHDQSNWTDITGNPTRYGTNPDIGCYEAHTDIGAPWGYGRWGVGKWGRGKWGGARW